MAGGSADAAAVLCVLRDLIAPTLTDERLETIGARVGSDVPFVSAAARSWQRAGASG